jgi:PAS domain-containing protein
LGVGRKSDRVLERTREATIELTSELVVLELGEAARAMYGLDDAAVRGRSLPEVLLTDSGPIDWAGHWASVLAGKPFEQIMLHRSCSGLRLWVLARLEARPGGARLWVRQASGREVLDQQFGGALQALLKMHALPLDGELTPQMLFGRMHPDDRSQAAAEIQRGIAERLPYDGVIRYKHGDGEYRHLRVFGGATYDSEGLALLSLGGVVDVSQELALRRRVRELEASWKISCGRRNEATSSGGSRAAWRTISTTS